MLQTMTLCLKNLHAAIERRQRKFLIFLNGTYGEYIFLFFFQILSYNTDDLVVASHTLSTSPLKFLFQLKVKPNPIQPIQKMDMSQIQQEWIAMRLSSFVQYASRYGLYLMSHILILSTSLLPGTVVVAMQGTFQIGSDMQE